MIDLYINNLDSVCFEIGGILFIAKLINWHDDVFSVEREIDVVDTNGGKYSMSYSIENHLNLKANSAFVEDKQSRASNIVVYESKIDVSNVFIQECLGGFFDKGGRFEGYVSMRKGSAFYNGELNPSVFSEDYEYNPKKYHLVSKIKEVEVLIKNKLTISSTRKLW